MPFDALSIVQRLAAVFDRLEIAYLVGGSIASIRYGEVRSTNDVDFVAELRLTHVSKFAELLQDGWYLDADVIADAIRQSGCFNVIDYQTMLKADVFIARNDAFTREQFARRRFEALGAPDDPVEAYIASPEDIVLQKLLRYKMGGGVSDRQWRDVLGVLIYQAGNLDDAYMDRWAREIEVSDLLARARQDAERPWNPR